MITIVKKLMTIELSNYSFKKNSLFNLTNNIFTPDDFDPFGELCVISLQWKKNHLTILVIGTKNHHI